MENQKDRKNFFIQNEEKTEGKKIKEFCEEGDCEVKIYNDRRYMRRKKKVA